MEAGSLCLTPLCTDSHGTEVLGLSSTDLALSVSMFDPAMVNMETTLETYVFIRFHHLGGSRGFELSPLDPP